MRDVKITGTGTGQEYVLTDDERDSFRRELSRTAPWRTLRTLIAFLLGLDRYPSPRVAPDAYITVTENSGAVYRYIISGRTVLQDERTQRFRQFYMGAVMLEWVY